MTLYIHFGIYKAGSSYIQYICANQRQYLKDNGIYFPNSVEDEKMKSGLISKGNADGLSLALKKTDKLEISKILKHWRKDAQYHLCNAVLVSAEALVFDLAIMDRLKLLINISHNIGFKRIEAMGYFRDLADHALSTYKHRAKTGKIPDYEYWIKEIYETPQLLNNLSQTIETTRDQINWTLRKFQKDSEFLKQAFFQEWLRIKVPKFKAKPIVNQSVMISEIKVLNHLKKSYPLVIDFFTDDLKKMPKSKKADDKELENFIFYKFITELKSYQHKLAKINLFFTKNEYLKVGDDLKVVERIKEPCIQLSDQQLQIINNRICFFNSVAGFKVLCRRRLINLYQKI